MRLFKKLQFKEEGEEEQEPLNDGKVSHRNEHIKIDIMNKEVDHPIIYLSKSNSLSIPHCKMGKLGEQ